MCLGGKYKEANTYLRRSLSHIEDLSKQGLSQDAYADVAGCLGDIAVNILKSKSRNDAESYHLLKRALYMSERAYRPNTAIVESSKSLLALASLGHDPDTANLMAHRMLDTNSIMQAFLYEGKKGSANIQDRVNVSGAARSFGTLAAVITETEEGDAALQIADTARKAILRHCGEGSADHARACMTLARAHFLEGRRLGFHLFTICDATSPSSRQCLLV